MERTEILEDILKEIDKHPEIMSRRDALKYFALSPLATSVITSASIGNVQLKASVPNEKIVIVGGGLAGISTAARLKNRLDNPDITIIEPEPLSASYQRGLTLVAAGIWDISQIQYNRDDKIPHGIKLIKGRATSFDPQNNTLTVDNKDLIAYKQLILATGVALNYAGIKGLSSSITSFTKNTDLLKNSGLTKNGLHSIFFRDGASATWRAIQQLIQKAKTHTSTTKLQAIFTHPNTEINCESASINIMYLVHSRLIEAKVRDKITMIYNTSSTNLHNVIEFHDAILKQFKQKNFIYNYSHNLFEINPENKVAIFEKYSQLDTKNEKIEMAYDFIHITPPMKEHNEITTSPLGSLKDQTLMNKETLQHVKFKNVWAIESSSVSAKHKVLVDNIISHMQNKNSSSKYTGYKAESFITNMGTAMLAEYDWSMKQQPSFPLNPMQARWIWWLMELYICKTTTISGMMKGYP